MKKFLTVAITASVLVLGSALPASAAGPVATNARAPLGNIVEVAVAASGGGTPDNNPYDYDILVQALIATGLTTTLSDPSTQFTVFAPNDRAFERLVTDLTGTAPVSEAATLATIEAAFTPAQIKNILLYHVVAGKKLGPLRVLFSRSITMANGHTIRPFGPILRDETPSLRDPILVFNAINIQASNGVIHTIDRVLVPAS